MRKPVIFDAVLSPEDIKRLREIATETPTERTEYDPYNGRVMFYTDTIEEAVGEKLLDIAREVFGDPTLKTSRASLVRYAWKESKLNLHIDEYAAKYTLDYILTQKTETWPIYIEDEPYYLEENQAIAFVGSEVLHYRDYMPDPENNVVEIVLMHYEPGDSWYFGNHCEDFRPEED
jgi:hypothetical protein|tara:strand:+ start:2828 stop:3355 length:528 start_codon:yes stop_codon:yes gene_type:complete